MTFGSQVIESAKSVKLTLLDTGWSRETHQVSQLAVGGPSSDKDDQTAGYFYCEEGPA